MGLDQRIKRVILESGAERYEMARRILGRLRGLPVEVIDDRGQIKPPSKDPAAWLDEAKSTLLLAVQRGPFWRPCPGTKDYTCCGYQVLQVTVNCPMDCTYCILQGYVNLPAITVFVNTEDLLGEIAARFGENPDRVWRLGTGEFGDSLALDGLTGLNEILVPWFAGKRQALLEIKSKWRLPEKLLALGPNRQVVFAWSLNPPEIIQDSEKFSRSLQERLADAVQAVAAGFRVAFHFDPIIYFHGWEEAYRRTVARLGEAIPASAIAWVSLGGLRLLPPLRHIIHHRFPRSRLADQEMIVAPDGKLRYFKTLRVEIYARMREWLSQAVPGALVYLCMESPRVWQEVFGFSPDNAELASLLDGRVLPLN
jgi:spore photoproduct lyase